MKQKQKSKIDPHHCKCFSISKQNFMEFVRKLQNSGFSEPFFEEDHGQIIGFTKLIYPNYQIHVKLMKTGRIEAEIEYSQEHPFAHLNPIHSFSAHKELNFLLTGLQIPHKCKKIPPITCIQRKIVPANRPMNMESVLKIGGLATLIDLALNDGKITSKGIDVLLNYAQKNVKRRASRRKYLNPTNLTRRKISNNKSKRKKK